MADFQLKAEVASLVSRCDWVWIVNTKRSTIGGRGHRNTHHQPVVPPSVFILTGIIDSILYAGELNRLTDLGGLTWLSWTILNHNHYPSSKVARGHVTMSPKKSPKISRCT